MQQLKRTLENSCNLLMDIFSGTYQDLRELFPARMLENLSVVANLAFGPGGTGPYQSEWVQRLPSNREYLGKLCSYFDAKQYHSMLEFLQNAHLCNDKMLKLLLQSPDLEQYSSQGKKSTYGKSICNLQKLMPLFGYRSSCTESKLQRVLADYNYIRLIRNMVNHASDTTGSEKELQDYQHMFQVCDYPDPAKMDNAAIKKTMEQILQRLEQAVCSRSGSGPAPAK